MQISGVVEKGRTRGKALGFPTANIVLNTQIGQGIYISQVQLKDRELEAVTFIGAAETFGEKEVKAEIYILDFDEDIYGKEIKVQILKKIRDVEKFGSKEELIKKMKEDERITREYFRGN